MQKVRLKTTIFLAMVLGSFSCSDFLENNVTDVRTISTQFSTFAGNQEVLNDCYENLEGFMRTNIYLYGDVVGGNVTFSPTITGTNAGLITVPAVINRSYNFENLPKDSQYNSFYDNSYKTLSSINFILTNIDKVDATTEQKNQVKAEALAMRAFIHHNLVRMFGQNYAFTANASHLGIVYADKIFVGGVDFPTRKTVAETYELLLADYKQAIDLYQNKSAISGPIYSYFNKFNTLALLSRAYLDKNDYNNAALTAQKVIAESGITLTSTGNYLSEWENAKLPTSETLMEMSLPVDSESTVGASLSMFFRYVSPTNYESFVASQDLLNLYDSNDIRLNNFLIKPLRTRVSSGNVNLNYAFTKKFQGQRGTVVVRLSEMYLILAEANAKNGQETQALSNLNIIRNRAGLSNITTTNNLIDTILLEKRREFCFEGHLFFDLARNKKSITRTLGCVSAQCNLNYPNFKYVLPIPLNSTNTNSNLIQNEGY